MSGEDTTIRGIVRALDGTYAEVEVEQGGCGRCHEKGGCGGQQLTQMFCSGPRTYRVANGVGAEVGNSVMIAIAAGSVRKNANLAYILPLTATIAGAVVGAPFGDGFAMAGGGIGLILSFLYIRFRGAGPGNPDECPHIISRS